jgi:6-phosphogluconolactonase
MHVVATPVLYVQKRPEDVVEALAEYVLQVQKEAIEKKGRFTVALSGGSLPKNLRGLIGMKGIDWDKW